MSQDVAFFVQTESGNYAQRLASAEDSGQLVSGTNKLAQRFVLELLTKAGDIPQSTAGCGFVDSLTLRNVRTESDVFTALAAALSTIVTNLQAVELDTDPDNERIKSVKIDKLIVSEGLLTLQLIIKTLSATAVPVSIPLNFLLL